MTFNNEDVYHYDKITDKRILILKIISNNHAC